MIKEELQSKIYEFEKKHRNERGLDSKENLEELKNIAREIMKQLEYGFILRAEWFAPTDNHSNIFKFLKSKNRTCKIYEGFNERSGIEALKMDKDFFMKYIKELFYLFFEDYQFEDSKKIITLTHDGDLKIEEKSK